MAALLACLSLMASWAAHGQAQLTRTTVIAKGSYEFCVKKRPDSLSCVDDPRPVNLYIKLYGASDGKTYVFLGEERGIEIESGKTTGSTTINGVTSTIAISAWQPILSFAMVSALPDYDAISNWSIEIAGRSCTIARFTVHAANLRSEARPIYSRIAPGGCRVAAGYVPGFGVD